MITMSLSEARQFLYEIDQLVERVETFQGEQCQTEVIFDYIAVTSPNEGTSVRIRNMT